MQINPDLTDSHCLSQKQAQKINRVTVTCQLFHDNLIMYISEKQFQLRN